MLPWDDQRQNLETETITAKQHRPPTVPHGHPYHILFVHRRTSTPSALRLASKLNAGGLRLFVAGPVSLIGRSCPAQAPWHTPDTTHGCPACRPPANPGTAQRQVRESLTAPSLQPSAPSANSQTQRAYRAWAPRRSLFHWLIGSDELGLAGCNQLHR